jgi:diguanylate cyclase (GGDEF)-like protein
VNPVPREKLLDSMSDGIMVLDYNYRLLDLNYAALTILSIDKLVVGKKAREVLPEKIMNFLEPLLNNEDCSLHLLHYHNKVFDMRISPLSEIGGKRTGYLIMFHDITEREILHQEIKERAKLDPLTQILNRRELFERINKEREKVMKNNTPLSILMMDIDHFKMINDTYGHETGDRTIEKIVEMVVQVIGKKNIFGRYGGDEFVIALSNTPSDKAFEIARNIHTTVASQPIESKHTIFSIHLSIGVVTVGGEGNPSVPDTSDALVALADSALYKAKERGRNTVVSLSMDGSARL